MKVLNLKSFKVKVTLALILCMLLSAAISDFLIYKFALDSQFTQLREKLAMVARTAALALDGDSLAQVPLNRQGVDTPQYKVAANKMMAIKQANPLIRYIYTLAKTEVPGKWQFIVDPDAPSAAEKKKGLTSLPGDKYDASRFPEMLGAFNGASADKQLETDEWGVTLSGYAPVTDSSGKAVAVLGIDIDAGDVYRIQKDVKARALLVLCLGLILSVILGLFISKRVTSPIKKLLDATRHLAKGNLKYKVNIKGDDEITELAESFDKMAASLYESRKSLHDYFYRIVQSLVRILQARDSYTWGHSEKVAEMSERIALKMGFNHEAIELIKEAAVLHDIGKLGVQESILNKKEKLTPQEWEAIRKHPIIGEDILKPVLLKKEMLSIIRNHHEYYDGNGYPDKLTGHTMNMFAQIVSVADAYDAMTSARVYRQAMNKRDALVELKRNSGTQFNPKVVEALLLVLGEI